MLKRFILWDYPARELAVRRHRGPHPRVHLSHPAGLVPRPAAHPARQQYSLLPAENGSSVFFVNTQMLAGIPENQRVAKLTASLRSPG